MNSRFVQECAPVGARFLGLSCCLCQGGLCSSREADEGICEACLGAMVFLDGALCRFCGKPLISEKDTCLSCRDFSQALPGVRFLRSVLRYEDLSRQFLHSLKFDGAFRLAKTAARLLVPLLEELWQEGCWLVPVPANPFGKMKRGYDQVRLILGHVPEPYRSSARFLLSRRGGKTQKSLPKSARSGNLRNKLFCGEKSGEKKRVILVDDLVTTGASLSLCAQTLLEAGYGPVDAVSLLRD